MKKSVRLLPWFGSNTENASFAGSLLDGCRWVGIPFGGGMCEVPWITAKQILVNDLHRHVVNLCCVIADDDRRQWLADAADSMPYHPDILATSQRRAAEFAAANDRGETVNPDEQAALAYFVAVWMGRGGKAGTTNELKGNLPIRWNANGGGSNRRYRTAIEALDEWGSAFRKCEFICMDGFEFLRDCKDEPENGIYCDPPWVGAGDEYLHRFSDGQHGALADVLRGFKQARVVVRYGDCQLIRDLYSSGWEWHDAISRDQANQQKPEVYLVRNRKG